MARTLDLERLMQDLETQAAQPDPLYLICGEEPLLVIEALDGLRAAARRFGHTERASFALDARSDWQAVLGATRNASLFNEGRLLELKLPSGKPGKAGADVLTELARMVQTHVLSDTIVIISLPRPDRTMQNSKWFEALRAKATLVQVPAVGRGALPDWIARRLAVQGQSTDRETLDWMADQVEGNLLAAFQEVQKLGLLHPEGALAAGDVQRAVLNVARYNVFDLRDAMLAAAPARALTMLEGLRAEGAALVFVAWTIAEDIRHLARLSAVSGAGGDIRAEMRRLRLFGNREALFRRTLARIPARAWPGAVQHAHDIDRIAKGLPVQGRLEDPWQELGRLILRIALYREN